jgi:hypothetical protein
MTVVFNHIPNIKRAALVYITRTTATETNLNSSSKTMNYGDAVVDTFYKSFSSAATDTSRLNIERARSWNQQRSAAWFDEVELLRVTATRPDLERFKRNIVKLKNRCGLDISASIVVPKSEELKQQLEQERMNRDTDLLDFLFPDKIPFLHDLLMTGEVETQFLRIEGSQDMISAFNRLMDQMLYDKNLTGVSIVVSERRKLMVDNVINPSLPTLSDFDSILDSIYSVDCSKSMPWLHRALTT